MTTVHSMSDQTQDEVNDLEARARHAGKKLKVEVIADDSGKFCGNGLRFETAAEAVKYGIDLSSRWMLVQKFRVAVDE